MRKLCIAALLLLSAELCSGQAPSSSLNVPTLEIYGGYMLTSPDYGPSFNSYLLNGAEAALSKAMTPRFSFIGSVAYVAGSFRDVKQISVTVGGKYNFLTNRFRPYATGQVGFAYQRSHGFYAADHHPPLPVGPVTIERGFTYRVGGGLDMQLTQRLSWRVAQWDFQPQPWGQNTPIYQNFSTGLGWHF
jgi:hypothetical protein